MYKPFNACLLHWLYIIFYHNDHRVSMFSQLISRNTLSVVRIMITHAYVHGGSAYGCNFVVIKEVFTTETSLKKYYAVMRQFECVQDVHKFAFVFHFFALVSWKYHRPSQEPLAQTLACFYSFWCIFTLIQNMNIQIFLIRKSTWRCCLHLKQPCEESF